MTAQIYRHRIEYGEDVNWEAPAGTAKWIAWGKTALMGAMPGGAMEAVVYGGEAPRWEEIGGYDVAGDAVLEFKARDLIENFEAVATADGGRASWLALVAMTGGLDSEVVQFVAYDADGRATRIDRYSVPVPNATDASTIAAQERRLLQTLLFARERAAGRGGVRKLGSTEGTGDEFESLAVLDRRVAECRARIAWFEQAAAGNILPRAEFW